MKKGNMKSYFYILCLPLYFLGFILGTMYLYFRCGLDAGYYGENK